MLSIWDAIKHSYEKILILFQITQMNEKKNQYLHVLINDQPVSSFEKKKEFLEQYSLV